LILLIKRKAFNGQLFLVYIIMYSIGRFWIEGLRTDSLMLTQNLRMAQVLSISLIFSALLVYFYLKKNKEEHYNGNYT